MYPRWPKIRIKLRKFSFHQVKLILAIIHENYYQRILIHQLKFEIFYFTGI